MLPVEFVTAAPFAVVPHRQSMVPHETTKAVFRARCTCNYAFALQELRSQDIQPVFKCC